MFIWKLKPRFFLPGGGDFFQEKDSLFYKRKSVIGYMYHTPGRPKEGHPTGRPWGITIFFILFCPVIFNVFLILLQLSYLKPSPKTNPDKAGGRAYKTLTL